MITKAFGSHPDAHVLIELALMEVALNDQHRETLEDAVEEPRRFRDYAFKMVSAVVPPEDDEDTTIADESLCPCTPAQRDRARSHIDRRLDEHSRLGDSVSSELSGSWRSTLATLLHEDSGRVIVEREEPPERTPPADVRKAYLQLARHYHPDKGGDHDMFITLQS